MSLYPAGAPSLLGEPSKAEKPHAERVVLQVTQPGGPIREGFLEVVALGLNKPLGVLKGHVPGSAYRTEADGKSYVKYQVIGKNHVAVPTHFFKVLILEAAGGQIELRSYVMPNAPVDEAIPLEHFLVPIESIERASGLLFVPNILARAGSLKAITAGSK